jgi:membrane protease YdiL (CAAX protease family)
MTEKNALLRPIWQSLFRRPLFLNLILFAFFTSLGAYGLLGPFTARLLLVLNSLLMCLAPLIFFSATGRREIGISSKPNRRWVRSSSLVGFVAGLASYVVGFVILHAGFLYWIVSLGAQLPFSMDVIAFTIPLLAVSAIGEEFFFRGMLYESIRKTRGNQAAARASAVAFGAFHLPNHGLLLTELGWFFIVTSTIIWLALMIGVSFVFTMCRQQSGSIWPAVLSHAAYNRHAVPTNAPYVTEPLWA